MSRTSSANQFPDRFKWLDGVNIRPYVFMRQDNRIKNPGQLHRCDWFGVTPVILDPLRMDEVEYVDHILNMEGKAFGPANLSMERWVFYDCGIMPGFIGGFAHRTATLPESIKTALGKTSQHEWTPLSLFIVIPAIAPGEWVAHNLSTINSILPKNQQLYGLGFLSKAFSLWYANVKVLCGMTQWKSPALGLHAHFGEFEVLTAYTPAHTYAQTLTYRVKVDPHYWEMFISRDQDNDFQKKYISAGFQVEASSEASQIEFQKRIEQGQGPFFLHSQEIRSQPLGSTYQVYRPR